MVFYQVLGWFWGGLEWFGGGLVVVFGGPRWVPLVGCSYYKVWGGGAPPAPPGPPPGPSGAPPEPLLKGVWEVLGKL